MANLSARITQANLTLDDGYVFVGNSLDVATGVAVTGDIAISNTGVTSIASGAIVNADVNASAAIAGSKIDPDFVGTTTITTDASSDSLRLTRTGSLTGTVYLGTQSNGLRIGTSPGGDEYMSCLQTGAIYLKQPLGIKTNSPDGDLHVYSGNANQTASTSADSLVVENSDSGGMSILCGPDGTGRIAFGDVGDSVAGRIDYNFTANSLSFGTNGVSNHLVIDSSGDVVVGNSASQSSLKFEVTDSFAIQGTSNPYASFYDGTTIRWYIRNLSSTDQFQITDEENNNGVVLSQDSNAWAALSDRRLKYDIQDLSNGLDTINAIRPVSYKWKSSHNETVGFIAQELQTVLPGIVNGEDDGVVTEVDALNAMSVEESKLIAYLVKAIQEQQELIEQLTSRIAALEAK